jgi:hypothetical protein
VQSLRQRDTEASAADKAAELERRRERRAELERRVAEYSGDNPLSPWLDYITWIQQTNVVSEGRAALISALERCTATFQDTARYRDDEAYLKVWITYADYVPDAEVVFAFLSSKGIGQTRALFYRGYAMVLEAKRQVRRAEEVLEHGILKGAQPRQRLIQELAALRLRTAKRIRKNLENGEDREDGDAEQRAPLSDLGPTRRKQGLQAPPAAQRGSLTGRPRAGIPVFDENVAASSAFEAAPAAPRLERHLRLADAEGSAQGSNSWPELGREVSRNKENNALPTTWTEPLRPARRRVEDPSSPQQMAAIAARPVAREAEFSVFEDASATESRRAVGPAPPRGDSSGAAARLR